MKLLRALRNFINEYKRKRTIADLRDHLVFFGYGNFAHLDDDEFEEKLAAATIAVNKVIRDSLPTAKECANRLYACWRN